MSRDISRFEKPELVILFQEKCLKAGLQTIITSVDRDYKVQYAFFLQGREPWHIVNEARKRAGLPPITRAENQKKITWTLNSEHVVNLEDQLKDNDKSRAFDFAIREPRERSVYWDTKADLDEDSIPDYLECARIGELLGLYSGGRFKNRDWAHLQIKYIPGSLPDTPIGSAH